MDVLRLAAALRPALASRGVPKAIYVDRGSAFGDACLLRACAKLVVRLVHSHTGGRNDHVVGLDRVDVVSVVVLAECKRPERGLARPPAVPARLMTYKVSMIEIRKMSLVPSKAACALR